MTKLEVQKRVLNDDKPLDLDQFEWNEDTNTFSSNESYLVLDFNGINGCTFNTGWNCIFDTGRDCAFKTGSYCAFKTGRDCTFNTGCYCTFNTGYCCTFKTGWNCIFNTDYSCIFGAGHDCTFDIGDSCTINAYYNVSIINNSKNSVVIIRDDCCKAIYDLDTLEKDVTLKLQIKEDEGE